MRNGFSLAEVRGMTLPEAEEFVDILFPEKTKKKAYISKRQPWRKWKKRYVRQPASTSGAETQG